MNNEAEEKLYKYQEKICGIVSRFICESKYEPERLEAFTREVAHYFYNAGIESITSELLTEDESRSLDIENIEENTNIDNDNPFDMNISSIPDEIIIEELRARGYSGNLSLKRQVNL